MAQKPKKVESMPTRKDWQTNHEALRIAFLKILKKKGSMPTAKEMSQATGLTEATIYEHYKHLKFEPQYHQSRALTDDIILAVAQSARRGNSQAQKLWFQVIEGWKESQNHNLTVSSWAEAMNNLSQETNEQEK